jgi:hypothetical protein
VTTSVELQAQRRQTMAEVGATGRWMTLNRQEWVENISGGNRPSGPPASLVRQRLLLVAPTTQLPERQTIGGITMVPEYILKGDYQADVQRGDWFYIDGVKYEVVFVHPNREYQVKAEVVYLG